MNGIKDNEVASVSSAPILLTREQVLTELIGPKGFLERDRYDSSVQEMLIGEALKQSRNAKNLTQEQLGKMVGVGKAQISRLEKGETMNLGTLARILKALDIHASIHFDNGYIVSIV